MSLTDSTTDEFSMTPSSGSEAVNHSYEDSDLFDTSCDFPDFDTATCNYWPTWPPIVIEAPNWPTGLSREGLFCFWRLLSPGPMTALLVIALISQPTIYLLPIYWPLDAWTGLLQMTFFLLWNYLTVGNLIFASMIGPGFLPKEWMPPKEHQKKELDYCEKCLGYKAPRSHHCSRCKRCVMKMDHHCPWIATCVGHRNHGYFMRFLFFAMVGCIHTTIILSLCFLNLQSSKSSDEQRAAFLNDVAYYDDLGLPEWLVDCPLLHRWSIVWQLQIQEDVYYAVSLRCFLFMLLAASLSLGVFTGLFGLFYFQLKGIAINQTAIESFTDEEAVQRRGEDDEKTDSQWFFPYDLGWKRNFREILFARWTGLTRGNGVWWPVAEPCDQFTFSREKMAQKKEMRRRIRYVKIIQNFAGGYFGSCRLGWHLFFSQPLTDEPRLQTAVGEKWLVIGASSDWYFGYKDGEEKHGIRGWFPRQVAQLLDERPF